MELGALQIIIVVQAAVIIVLVILYGYKIKRDRSTKETKSIIVKIPYHEARELCRQLLIQRYQGQRGFIKPYVREFDFPHNSETLRKVLQETNPVPNRHYLQTVLNDIAAKDYEVLPFPRQFEEEVA